MATGTGPCRSATADQSPDELGEGDLRVVFNALHSVAENYKFLAVEMNLMMNEIKRIQRQFTDPNECLLEVLSVRLKQIPSLRWRDIDAALRSGPVGEVRLANRIREKYGHLYPSSQASLDHTQDRNISEMTKNPTMEEKKEMKYAQKQEIDQEVSESERYRKPSAKLQVDSDLITNKALVKETQAKAKESPYTKRHSEPDKDYEGEMQPEGKTTKATHDKEKGESEVIDGHKENSEQRATKRVQKASEGIASSSEKETESSDNYETAKESFSSEYEKDSAEEHDIQPKKRSRRRHRESSMSPTTRGSSSPSTSQEEGQRKPDPKEQRRKNKKGKDHKKKGKPRTKNEKGEASDSSPECDRLSESEKLRINVFERFYGQLCCQISNPVETAAELQKKGLVSIAFMKDLMRSPESQQEKTIILVDKLNETIKSQPDCLFTFIETLLENEALQKVGSEILTTARK